MLDYRIKTFLELAQIKNYTETAKKLHTTQPNITQHIQYLEKEYNTKLFIYKNKTLNLTPEGEIFYKYAITLYNSSNRLEEALQTQSKTIIFGTTLTVGQYTFNRILSGFIQDHPDLICTMYVDNTENLIAKLETGDLDFIILEGHFDKSKYAYRHFKKDDFVAISSFENPINSKDLMLNELLDQTLILREKGSGTRNIFELILHEQNLSVSSFKKVHEVANMEVIKNLVHDNLGISFLYHESIKNNKNLNILNIQDFKIERDFNFVYLKGALFEDTYHEYFDYFIEKEQESNIKKDQ